MEYLLSNGIEKDRLRFKVYGESSPKVPIIQLSPELLIDEQIF